MAGGDGDFAAEWATLRGEAAARLARGEGAEAGGDADGGGTSAGGAAADGDASDGGASDAGAGSGGDASDGSASDGGAATDGGSDGLSPAQAAADRREAVLERLADFRSRVVLVPLDDHGGPWVADLGGMGWICAFVDETALSRFAEARGEAERTWTYRRVLGRRLLDEIVPRAGFVCGIVVNAAGPDGMVLPPVAGIVPRSAALDGGSYEGT